MRGMSRTFCRMIAETATDMVMNELVGLSMAFRRVTRREIKRAAESA